MVEIKMSRFLWFTVYVWIAVICLQLYAKFFSTQK